MVGMGGVLVAILVQAPYLPGFFSFGSRVAWALMATDSLTVISLSEFTGVAAIGQPRLPMADRGTLEQLRLSACPRAGRTASAYGSARP